MIEIHEVFPSYYEYLKNTDGILTFDDGLYSQYMFLKQNPEVCKRSIVFISTNIIRDEAYDPITAVVLCDEAHMLHDRIVSDDRAYMSVAEIKELRDLGVTIGYHGHNHIFLGKLKPSQKALAIKNEVIESVKFNDEHKIFSNIFCSPYNDYSVLKFYIKYYETKIGKMQYVENRTPLETLLGLDINNRWMYKIPCRNAKTNVY